MPPTKLGQFGYRRFDNQGSSVSRAKGAAASEPKLAWLRGPWAGYEPDLEPSQAQPGSARFSANLIDRDGALAEQPGFSRIDSAHLPLGDTTPPSSAGEAEPIVALFEGRTNATQAIRRYAISSDDSADGGGYFGHLYELVAGVWTHRAATVPADSYKGVAGDPAATLADAAHFAPGDYTVFVGGVSGNFLHRFPGVSVATEYERVANLGALTSLGAQSVVASEERLLVFNTNENGTIQPARLRWTSKGANARFDPTITGSGFADFNEFGSEGLLVRNIGPKIALYFINGVQFIRRTGIVVDPFAKDYAAYGRGLLSTHSLVDIGNATHFGIFNDGWFYLNHTGNWQEVGVTQSSYHKWLRQFYGNLDWDNRKRVTVAYDSANRLIYIGWPDSTNSDNAPNTVWIYDMKTDSVWPAPDWPQQPNIIKQWTEESSPGASIDSMTVPIDSVSAAIDSFGPVVGQQRIAHGTAGGLVYQHSNMFKTRDGTAPTFNYSLQFFGGERTDRLKRVDRTLLSYTRQTGATPITVTMEGNNGRQVTGVIRHTKGDPGEKQVDFISGAVTDHQHSVSISGQVPVAVDGIGLQVSEIDSVARKEQAP